MSLRDCFGPKRAAPEDRGDSEKPLAPSVTLHIAVLAVRYGDDTVLQWAWASNSDERFALGHALKSVGAGGTVIGKTVIRIPVEAEPDAEADVPEDDAQ